MILSLVAAAVVASSEEAKRESEFATVDSVVRAVYSVISGPIGQKRDRPRMRSLFAPEARLTAIDRKADGTVRRTAFTVEEYIRLNAPFMEERGFFEREVARRIERFGEIAHVFSTYESRWKADDPKPFARGLNSFQLTNDGTRWWVHSLVWQSASPSLPIPAKYEKSDGEDATSRRERR